MYVYIVYTHVYLAHLNFGPLKCDLSPSDIAAFCPGT